MPQPNDNTYQYPEGETSVLDVAAAATMDAPEIKNSETIINISEMAAAGTLNLTINDAVRKGANLTVKAIADATGRTLTLGTGLSGNAYAIGASKTAVLTFKYDGTTFINTSAILIN